MDQQSFQTQLDQNGIVSRYAGVKPSTATLDTSHEAAQRPIPHDFIKDNQSYFVFALVIMVAITMVAVLTRKSHAA